MVNKRTRERRSVSNRDENIAVCQIKCRHLRSLTPLPPSSTLPYPRGVLSDDMEGKEGAGKIWP